MNLLFLNKRSMNFGPTSGLKARGADDDQLFP